MIGFWSVASRIVTIIFVLVAITGKVSANSDTSSTLPDCKVPINCCCSYAAANPDGTNKLDTGQVDDPKNDYVEQITKLADMTLRGVGENTSFLSELWTWTVVIVGIIIFVIGFFGIKTYQDIEKKFSGYSKTIDKLKEDYNEFTKKHDKTLNENTANHTLMIYSIRAEYSIYAAIEAKRKAKLETNEKEKEHLINYAKYMINAGRESLERVLITSESTDKKDLKKVLNISEPTDKYVGAFAYGLYGYILSEMGELSPALIAAKKSLEFKPNGATALYNAACYAARMNLSTESIDYLIRAVEFDHKFFEEAKSDNDFDNIRLSKEYINFVGK